MGLLVAYWATGSDLTWADDMTRLLLEQKHRKTSKEFWRLLRGSILPCFAAF